MMSLMWPNHNQARTDEHGDHRRAFLPGSPPGSARLLLLLIANGRVDSACTGRRGEGESGREEVLRRAQGSLCFSTSGLYIKPLINPE